MEEGETGVRVVLYSGKLFTVRISPTGNHQDAADRVAVLAIGSEKTFPVARNSVYPDVDIFAP
jgi:hypothetical protein